jgi:hypothetical protein
MLAVDGSVGADNRGLDVCRVSVGFDVYGVRKVCRQLRREGEDIADTWSARVFPPGARSDF